MADSLSVNNNLKTWTVQVPQAKTSANPWAYSLFNPGGVVAYPETSLSTLNDNMLFQYDCGATNLLNGSAAMLNQILPMMQKWQAQQAQIYYELMQKLNGAKPNVNINSTTSNSTTGTNTLDESKIISTLDRIGNSKKYGDKINMEITYKDKDGNEIKTTLLRRLIQLSKDYQECKDDAELSKENYEKIWEIAGKYAETGELSTDDLRTLKEIALNPGSKSEETDPDEGENGIKKDGTVDRSANYNAGYQNVDNDLIARKFFDAMDGAGTNKGKLKEASDGTDKYNVIEVIEKFNKINGRENGNETMIDAIFDDCDNWGTGESKWYRFGMDDDDARPFVTELSQEMMDRAKDITSLPNTDEETKTLLQTKIKALQDALTAADNETNGKSTDLSDEKENAIKQAFKDLFNTIKLVEEKAYGIEK